MTVVNFNLGGSDMKSPTVKIIQCIEYCLNNLPSTVVITGGNVDKIKVESIPTEK